ncbi:hypothetical protein [Fictibacillus barbaricus]|uniref:DUF5590 domain-containing protein n=1 Tax=Fictibacillus barbaricus TaxID=182136 RepID=A0ABU1TWA5_9BACL|nr:hypothetical protein [Fictibacillus barbaricus]MDR7071492.1 hypothetical protein [Fictibacillus barbaricus]
MIKKSKLIVITLILLLIGVVFFTFVQLSYPIRIDGVSTSTKEDGKKEIVFQFYNLGLKRITIKEVTLNHRKQPKELALGISYDTEHLVQSGIDNPMIKFMKVDAAPIKPKLNKKEITDAFNRKENTPIYYGIKMEFEKEPIKSMTVKYKYFGFLVTKKYDLELWNLEN